jgi:hypothetical protein
MQLGRNAGLSIEWVAVVGLLLSLDGCTHFGGRSSSDSDRSPPPPTSQSTPTAAPTQSRKNELPPSLPAPSTPPSPAARPAPATPSTPSPPITGQPASTAHPPSSARSPAPERPKPAQPAKAPPVARAASGASAAEPPEAGSRPTSLTSPPPPPALDLTSLEQRLKDTHAIGVFTKLSLKNQVDDLLAAFRAFHDKRARKTLAQLRQQYDGLLLKVLSLLQDGDPSLAMAISSSREAIWGILTDPQKFSKI